MRRTVSIITALMLVLSALLVLFTFSTSAAQLASGTCGDGVNWVLNDTGTLTISGYGAMYDYTEGSAPWYSKRYSISNAVITNGVTNVGSYAFYDCTGLFSVILSDSVTVIGDHAFFSCESLADAALGSGLTVIEQNAFLGCLSLERISLPSTLNTLDGYAFQNCLSLSEITVDENNNYFSSADGVLFNKDMTALLLYPSQKEGSAYTLPDTVKRIGKTAFANSMLESISLPPSVSVIEFGAFWQCYDLSEINVDPASVYLTSIDGVLFSKNGKVLIAYPSANPNESYTVPSGTAHIGDGAFNGCSTLANVVISDGAAYIGHSAFIDCTSLKTVVLPGSIKEMSDWSFAGCAGLETLTFNGTVSTWNKIRKASSWGFLSGTETEVGTFEVAFTNISFSASSSGLCGDSLTWSIDGTGTLSVSGTGAMYNYKADSVITPPWNSRKGEIRNVVIGEGVTSIGDYAFESCTNIQNVMLADSVVYIGENAFALCSSLGSVTLPESLNSLHALSFRDCYSLYEIKVDDNNNYFSSVGGVLFNKDKTVLLRYPPNNAENAYIVPESVRVIAAQAFAYSPITVVNIPSGVSMIDMNAFFASDRLATIRFIGTERQWKTVVGGEYWDTYAGANSTKGTYELVFVSADDILYGDATGDGIIDNKDLVRIKKYLAAYDYDTGISTVEADRGADATGDGIIDNKDLVRLKKYLAAYDYDTGTSSVVLGPTS